MRANSSKFFCLLSVLAVLTACDPNATDPGPGGVNAGDAKALDDAAKKLDERQSNPGKGKTGSE